MTRAVILSAVRTPIGRYAGGLASIRPDCVWVGQGQAALFERRA